MEVPSHRDHDHCTSPSSVAQELCVPSSTATTDLLPLAHEWLQELLTPRQLCSDMTTRMEAHDGMHAEMYAEAGADDEIGAETSGEMNGVDGMLGVGDVGVVEVEEVEVEI